MMDRIDIHVQVPRVDNDKLSDKRMGESSKAVRAWVEAPRDRQRIRFTGLKDITANAYVHPAEVHKVCDLDATCTSLMKTAIAQPQLSARAFHHVLKLARTIADLVGRERIGASHLAEALQYRPRMNEG